MRKIMVFQHVGHEPLGTLDPMLKDAGLRIRYVNFGRNPELQPSMKGYSGLVVLGGPMGVCDVARIPHLQTEMKVIETALKMDVPVLGICLGSQLIAHVLGGQVSKAAKPEVGWCDVHLTPAGTQDRLFTAHRPAERVFQMHEDAFTLPNSVEHLASSPRCKGQAFRYMQKVYGMQFHPEADLAMIRRWMKLPESRRMVLESGGLYNLSRIEQDTTQYIARSLDLSRSLFGKFIDLFGIPKPSGLPMVPLMKAN